MSYSAETGKLPGELYLFLTQEIYAPQTCSYQILELPKRRDSQVLTHQILSHCIHVNLKITGRNKKYFHAIQHRLVRCNECDAQCNMVLEKKRMSIT